MDWGGGWIGMAWGRGSCSREGQQKAGQGAAVCARDTSCVCGVDAVDVQAGERLAEAPTACRAQGRWIARNAAAAAQLPARGALLPCRRIDNSTKLVGPVINCEAVPYKGNCKGNKWRRNPHVQSYALATDRVGLQVLLVCWSPPPSLACNHTMRVSFIAVPCVICSMAPIALPSHHPPSAPPSTTQHHPYTNPCSQPQLLPALHRCCWTTSTSSSATASVRTPSGTASWAPLQPS